MGADVFTVYAPIPVEGGVYNTTQTWSRIDTDLAGSYLDIGYHHNRVDVYLGGGCTYSGGTVVLTLDPGVAVGLKWDAYLVIGGGAKLESVGHPITKGYSIFSNSKSLSMNTESPKFEFTENPTANPYIYIGPDASAGSRVEFTKTSWLGWGLMVGRELSKPIQGSVFSLSSYGVRIGEGSVLSNNLLFHNCRGAYAIGSAQILYSTFDLNQIGADVTVSSGEETHVRDCLFTKNDVAGIKISGAGQTFNYYNGFWSNYQNVLGGTAGNGSKTLTVPPYDDYTASAWQERYRLEQVSTIISGGSVRGADAGLAAYTTATDSRYDTGYVDWGFHFLARKSLFVSEGYQGTPDGSPLRPYGFIQAAVGAAEDDTTVLLGPGKYDYLVENQQIVAKSHVDIIGNGQGATILDAHDVRATSGQSYPLIVIDGKTDIAVAAMTITRRYNEDWYTGQFHGKGGGMICRNSTDITVRDCLVTENDADWGGGFYLDNSAVTIEDCIIHQNRAISGKAGGGLYIESCSKAAGRLVTLNRCMIANNTAGTPDEAPEDLTMGGGAVYCISGSDPEIKDCIISHNRASGYRGGGIYLGQNCSATIWNCVVEHNMSTSESENQDRQGDGGGIYVLQSSPAIWGCTISDNTSVKGGSGIRCEGTSCAPLITNCTVAYNSGPDGTAGIYFDQGASPTIKNCILWENGDDLKDCSATYSCIQNGDAGDHNISADPHFVGSVYGPYHIADTSEVSPCFDAGTTSGLPKYFKEGKDVDGDSRVIGAIDIGSDERHPFRQMIGIKRVFAQNKVTITWRTDTGPSYGVYSSTDPFTNYMSWGERATVQGNGGVVSWDDTQVSFASGTQAYYKILAKTGAYAGQFSRPVGLINADVEDIDTDPSELESAFMAMPLELKYQTINGVSGHVDEGLGSMIGGYFQGEHLNQDDQIQFLKLGHPDWPSTWSQLQLKWSANEPKWYDGAVESRERFSLGEAFRIVGPPTGGGAQGSRSTITFLGFVPSRPVELMPFRSPFGGRYVEFGYPYPLDTTLPVDTTLNDIPFFEYGAPPKTGQQWWEHDQILVPVSYGWVELWLDDEGDGQERWKYVGGGYAGSPYIDVVPGKGFRYYGAEDELAELVPPPDSIGNRIYYYRVPAVRPYRCE